MTPTRLLVGISKRVPNRSPVRLWLVQLGRLAGYVGDASFPRMPGTDRPPVARWSRSANAIQLGKLVLGEGERRAVDVVAQVRDG
jgi:hypothetical protein